MKVKKERGFILVTSLVLLAILMGLAAVAMFKTNIEMKVSAGSVGNAKAFAAAQAGLDYTYYYWTGVAAGTTELKNLANAATDASMTALTTPALPAILINQAPEKLADISATAAEIDDWVKVTEGVRVYTLDGSMAATTNANWASNDAYAQVAVWTTRFKKPSTPSDYPYIEPYSSACSDCVIVVYALGRAKGAYKLLREYTFETDSNIQAFGAMVNAPTYGSCDPDPNTTISDPVPSSSTLHGSHLIDATQAPAGVAMASNNSVVPSSGDEPWDTNYGTGTALGGIQPWVLYDPGKVDDSQYPNIAGGEIGTLSATVVDAELFNTTPMDYFSSADAQLFPLNAYREAANRIAGFRTETLKNDPSASDATETGYSVNTGDTSLGNYATLITTADGNTHHRMGTLQYDEWIYNIQNSIPMYGLIRLLIPVTKTGTTDVCGTTENTYKPTYDTLALDPLGAALEAPDGNLIVYGGALLDFFWDMNKADGTLGADDIYQPELGDRLLSPKEALVTGKVNVDSPLVFNPAMDGMTPRPVGVGVPSQGSGDYTNIFNYPVGSPSWDQDTDAMSSTADGEMDLIWDVWNVGKNSGAMVANEGTGVYAPGLSGGFGYWMNNESSGVIRSTATGGGTSWSDADKTRMKTLLDYYIRTTASASKNIWSHGNLAAIEGDYRNFFIDTKNDLIGSKPSAADLYHAFLPSGYIHGWKRAMVETGLAAEGSVAGPIWNTDLIADDSPYASRENKVFYISGVGTTAKIDKDFADIPAEMYAGGLVDMHHAVNISGVVYTPGQLELEQKVKGVGPDGGPHGALQYLNGVIITGNGVLMKKVPKDAVSRTVIVYDDASIDNLPTNKDTITMGRKYWQELK